MVRFLAVVLAFLALSGISFAQIGNICPPGAICIQNPLQCTSIPDCAGRLIAALLAIAVPVVSIMVLVGGFRLMTAGGSPEKVESGRKIILYAVVGFVVVLGANAVVAILRSLL